MRNIAGRKLAPLCPFCGAELQQPSEITINEFEKALGGTCLCGAVFLVDQTGKNAGTIMAQGLGLAAELLHKELIDMVPDQDYRDAIISYDWRLHRSAGVSAGFADGYGRLYIIQVKKGGGGN